MTTIIDPWAGVDKEKVLRRASEAREHLIAMLSDAGKDAETTIQIADSLNDDLIGLCKDMRYSPEHVAVMALHIRDIFEQSGRSDKESLAKWLAAQCLPDNPQP